MQSATGRSVAHFLGRAAPATGGSLKRISGRLMPFWSQWKTEVYALRGSRSCRASCLHRRRIGRSFERIPGEFELEKGVKAFVYAKVRPLENADLVALAAEFAKYYPDRKSMFDVRF